MPNNTSLLEKYNNIQDNIISLIEGDVVLEIEFDKLKKCHEEQINEIKIFYLKDLKDTLQKLVDTQAAFTNYRNVAEKNMFQIHKIIKDINLKTAS